jgi:uncharacterized RDD family membrane protein YckC
MNTATMPTAAASATDGTRVRVAGFWRRAGASVIDLALLAPLVIGFGGAAAVVAGGRLPRLGELGFDYVVRLAINRGTAELAALTMAAIVVFLYQLVFTATGGQTPGKRLVHARVIDTYGGVPSAGRALVRVLASALSVALFSLGWLWIGFSRDKRGLHDLVAGTYVVIVDRSSVRAGQPVAAP